MFAAVLTTVRHVSSSWDKLIRSTLFHLISCSPILILSSHLLLGVPSDSFFQVFLPNPCMYEHIPSPTSHIPHHIITIIIPCNPSLCSLLPSRPTYAQTSSSAPRSRTPSAYVFPSCERPSFTPTLRRVYPICNVCIHNLCLYYCVDGTDKLHNLHLT